MSDEEYKTWPGALASIFSNLTLAAVCIVLIFQAPTCCLGTEGMKKGIVGGCSNVRKDTGVQTDQYHGPVG